MNDETVRDIALVLQRNWEKAKKHYIETYRMNVDTTVEDWEFFFEQSLRLAMRERNRAEMLYLEFQKAHKRVLEGAFK